MSDRKARKTFDREFKISSVKLVLDSERSIASIPRIWEYQRTHYLTGRINIVKMRRMLSQVKVT